MADLRAHFHPRPSAYYGVQIAARRGGARTHWRRALPIAIVGLLLGACGDRGSPAGPGAAPEERPAMGVLGGRSRHPRREPATTELRGGSLVAAELASPFVRTVVGPPWDKMPTPPTRRAGSSPDPAAFYEYVATNFTKTPGGGDGSFQLRNARRTIEENHAHGASIVLGFFGIPEAYRGASGLENVRDFAALWIAQPR